MSDGMKREDVADFGSVEVVTNPDAVYVAIGRHVIRKDTVVIWTGLLGWVPLTDAIPAQLLNQQQATDLRGAMTSKFDINVIRVLPPVSAGAKGIRVQ